MSSIRREPWLREQFELAGVPAMVSRSEQRYLYWLTRTQWRDEGHVVEIGPWLGGSTLCLAEGMAASGRSVHKLHAFDNFMWRDFMTRFAPLPLRDGESFQHVFEDNVSAHRDRIVSHRLTLPDETIPGDAHAESVRGADAPRCPEFRWDANEPIEILFVDGAKSWRGMRWLLRSVAASLRPGRTLLVCQDFKHWASSWVPLLIARIRDRLEIVHVVRRGSTVTFRVTRPIERELLEALPDEVMSLATRDALSDIDAMANWIASAGDPLGAAHVRLGRVQLLAHHGRAPEALQDFENIQASWPIRGSKGQLDDARRYLEARGLSAAPYRAWSRWMRAFRPMRQLNPTEGDART